MTELLRKQLRKFMKVLPKVLNDEDPEAVHDVRVSSRRLQQVLITMFPRPRSGLAQDVVDVLRRARGAVGGWRDSDVLIEMVERKVKAVRNSDERRAWEAVHALLSKRRKREVRRARRKLAHRRIFTIEQDVKRLTEASARDGGHEVTPRDPADVLSKAIRNAYQQWCDAFALAVQTEDPGDVHAFRIKVKRLRYGIELARDLGAADSAPELQFLKSLQDGFGKLHDRIECARMAADALADPELLMREPGAASLLLRRLAGEQKAQRIETAKMLSVATAGAAGLDRWVRQYCGSRGAQGPAPSDDGRVESRDA